MTFHERLLFSGRADVDGAGDDLLLAADLTLGIRTGEDVGAPIEIRFATSFMSGPSPPSSPKSIGSRCSRSR